MPHTGFESIYDHVVEKMKALSPELSYHCVNHTLDVVLQSSRIALDEGINQKEKCLLKIAALYHDTGFLHTYADHEKKSCEIFLEDAHRFGFNEAEKSIITSLIMATKVPQQPKNLLQKIICDADLDYLGRKDFASIADLLREEFLHFHVVPDEASWHKLQVKFLHNHQYHTNSSKLLREPLKKKNLDSLGPL